MTRQAFNLLYDTIRRNWERSSGLIVHLKSGPTDDRNIRLCIGPLTNKGLIAQSCRVWEGDKTVYQGTIDTMDLQKLLTAKKICCAILTNAQLMATSKTRKLDAVCCGNREACTNAECVVKRTRKKSSS